MKRFLICLSAFLILSGCYSAQKKEKAELKKELAQAKPLFAAYLGPKAKVTLADVDIKVPRLEAEIGQDLRGMIASALVNSGRFNLTDNKTAGSIQQNDESVSLKPKKKKKKPPELNINISLIEFEPQASGGKSGVGGGGGAGSSIMGGLLRPAQNKARMMLEVRILDKTSSKLLALNRVMSQTVDIFGSVMSQSSAEKWPLGASLEVYSGTPMEKAIRACIVETVRYISDAVPGYYYKS